MAIGDKLKKAREEKGLDFKEVENGIKIRKRYLEALEDDNYNLIPGEAYVRAFIKSYATHLGLDYEELIDGYNNIKEEERRRLEEEEEEENKSSYELLQNKTFVSSIIIAVIILILVILTYNIFLLNDSKNEVNVSNEINSDFTSIAQEDINEENLILNEEKNNIEEDSNGDLNNSEINIRNHTNLDDYNEVIEEDNKLQETVDIIVTEKTWLQIFADGNKVYEGILDSGDNRSYDYSNNITMKIGNAAGIQVRKDNRLLGPWGEQGEVIEKTIGSDNGQI